MKYAIRAVKYFLYITLIFAVVIWLFSCWGHHKLVLSFDEVLSSLTNGINSVWMILGVFAAVSCVYPLMGYMKRQLDFSGSIADMRDAICAFMDERGYIFEKETEDSISFRLRSPMNRLTRTYEDRVTISQSARGLEMEGIRKDVVRLAMGLETRMGSRE